MRREEGKYELELMRGYEESFRERLCREVSLSYECVPLDREQYERRVAEVMEEMKSIDPKQKELSVYDELILGRIEGQLGSVEVRGLVESVVGEVSQQKLKAYLKQKTQQRNYGLNGKDKSSSVRQVRKLQLLKKYYNLTQIQKKRKYNKLYSLALKSLHKYLELYQKIDPEKHQTIQQAFDQYTNYTKEEKKFNNYVKELQQDGMRDVIQGDKRVVAENKHMVVENRQVVAAQQSPIQEENKIEEQLKADQAKNNPQIVKQEQKSSQEKNQPTPKKHRSKKKQSKTEQNKEHKEQQQGQRERTEENKEARVQKDKTNKKEQKSIKKNPNNSLITQFFTLKKKDNPQSTKKPSTDENIPLVVQGGDNQPVTKQKSLWDCFCQNSQQFISSKSVPLKELRSEYRNLRMQDEQYSGASYYTNIVITLSTLEYYDYFISPERYVDFAKPFHRISEVYYFEDESEEFEGESADEEQESEDEDQHEMQSQLSHNNTILDDDHLSNEELSSCEPYEVDLKVEYGKATKWVFNCKSEGINLYTNKAFFQQELLNIGGFEMVCLEEGMPLGLQQEEDTSPRTVITSEMWVEVYKLSHGYYGTKENMIKEIGVILGGVSKTWVDTMLKQRTEKVNNQRLIKREFIEDLREKHPQIESILQKVLMERSQQLRRLKAERNLEKDLKLEKDILECVGSRYIVNLLKQLKEKGYKQLRRNQLIEFINERKGEDWEKIKVEINTMSRPIVEMIKSMVNGEKIDQEVVVGDEEYRRLDEENLNKPLGQRDQHLLKQSLNVQQSKKQIDKQRKRKRRANNINMGSIYQKTKPISRGRRTKNSLKTGVISIDQLKKLKQQELNIKEGEQEEHKEGHEEYQHINEEQQQPNEEQQQHNNEEQQQPNEEQQQHHQEEHEQEILIEEGQEMDYAYSQDQQPLPPQIEIQCPRQQQNPLQQMQKEQNINKELVNENPQCRNKGQDLLKQQPHHYLNPQAMSLINQQTVFSNNKTQKVPNQSVVKEQNMEPCKSVQTVQAVNGTAEQMDS